MNYLSEKDVEHAFEKWNEAYVKHPEKFNELIHGLSECKTVAEKQTKTLFKYAGNRLVTLIESE